MRYLILTVAFFIIATVIKIDLTEGTVPLAAFSSESDSCNEQLSVKTVTVKTKEGDSVQSLLASYPTDEHISLPERLAHFYQANPHLKNQTIVPGEFIKLPIYSNSGCQK